MAASIIEKVQTNLGLSPVQKVDRNIQEVKDKESHSQVVNLSQAALPAVMAGLFKITRTEDGTMDLVKSTAPADCLREIFHGHDTEAVAKVARYANVSEEVAREAMNDIAAESVKVLREEAGEDPSYEKVEHYMNRQRHEILVHLPAALQMGQLLEDDTMDDRTNKMEGPVSTFMNKLGDNLADGESKQGTF